MHRKNIQIKHITWKAIKNIANNVKIKTIEQDIRKAIIERLTKLTERQGVHTKIIKYVDLISFGFT